MKKFSLVIPVYKQEKTVFRDLNAVIATLSKINVPFEVIAVIDGQLDQSQKNALKIRDNRLKVVGYQTNHGKGYAVRYGFAKAEGEVIGFMDGGGDLSSSSLPLMLQLFEWEKADAVIGSKRHSDSKVIYPFYRQLISRGYQVILWVLFGLNISDTQVGMKLYRRKLLEDVLPRLLVKEFAFDIEILAVAHHLGYSKIIEAPVEINLRGVLSSITFSKLIRIIFRTLQDTLAVFYRLKILKYYDNDKIRKWRFDPELNFRINTG
jgi:glycosyltransferase involved in cell wall biosynthesis